MCCKLNMKTMKTKKRVMKGVNQKERLHYVKHGSCMISQRGGAIPRQMEFIDQDLRREDDELRSPKRLQENCEETYRVSTLKDKMSRSTRR